MEKTHFFSSLDYSDGLLVVTSIFKRYPMQYGTTLGLDGDPQIRPLEFKFEEDGVLYFDTVDNYTSYQEMLNYPYIKICIGDQDEMSYLTVSGRVNFTKEADIVERCFDNSEVLTSQYGSQKDHVIAYYLTETKAQFCTFKPGLSNQVYDLPNKYDRSEKQ